MFMDKVHEECGVFGIYSAEPADVVWPTYYALYALQHRGQESCGIAVNDDGIIHSYKDAGLVSDVFKPEVLERLGKGNMAIGHVRYGTTAHDPRLDAQPLVVNHVKGCMALANNGSLTNYSELIIYIHRHSTPAVAQASSITECRCAFDSLPYRGRAIVDHLRVVPFPGPRVAEVAAFGEHLLLNALVLRARREDCLGRQIASGLLQQDCDLPVLRFDPPAEPYPQRQHHERRKRAHAGDGAYRLLCHLLSSVVSYFMCGVLYHNSAVVGR